MFRASIEAVTDGQILESLRGDVCPACGGVKERRRTFCRPCYFRLTGQQQKDLYKRFGAGYAEAVRAAIGGLGVLMTLPGSPDPVTVPEEAERWDGMS
jgi:hypothetical protein